jgi:histidinol-phosphate phosphatase family protein
MSSNGCTKSVQRPKQAVILAGGRGTRMRPLTDTRPKAMIEFHGKPFMEYVVRMLQAQGFERVLMLLGYLPEVIENYFGDGRHFGVHIEYSVSDADTLTSRRVQLADHLIEPCFMMMYCDNYWPMRMDDMWDRFAGACVPAMTTIYRNDDNFSRDSVSIGEDGFVKVFDRTRTTPGLKGVEIGYAILTREVLELLPKEEMLVEDALYVPLAQQHRLLAYVTSHRYYSVGSLERLTVTDAFFANHPAVILDRDGVLNRRPPRAEYIQSWADFEWLPGAKDALRMFHEAGFRVVVVSNQAGIARKLMAESDLARIHECMKAEAERAGGQIDAIYYCPHGWDDACDCRKPTPGMLFRAQRDFHFDLRHTFFVGDDDRDREAAEAAGCLSMMVTEHRSLLDCAREIIDARKNSPNPIKFHAEERHIQL